MVFEGHHDTALLGLGDALFDALNAPFEPVVLFVAGQNWLDAARLHQVIEIFDRVPSARVKPDARHAQFVCDLQAFVRVLDLFLPFLRIGLYEILVN